MTSGEFRFITDLISYKPLGWLTRIVVVGLIGGLCLFMTEKFAETSGMSLDLSYLFFIAGFIVVSEVNVLFSFLVSKSKIEKIKQHQMLVQIIFNVIMILVTIYILLPFEREEIRSNPMVRLSTAFISIFNAFVVLVITLIRVLREAFNSYKEVSALQQAKKELDYRMLVEQMSPHFLFNSLSVLKSLILYDKNKAVTYVQNFTDIYRYVLQVREKNTVLFSEELEFVQAYLALHKERIGEGLVVEYDIDDKSMAKEVLPLSVQILAENAIKHNIATKAEPLTIKIVASEDCITVKNNLNKRDAVYYTRKGIDNISKRYEFLGGGEIHIEKTETEYIVVLPTL